MLQVQSWLMVVGTTVHSNNGSSEITLPSLTCKVCAGRLGLSRSLSVGGPAVAGTLAALHRRAARLPFASGRQESTPVCVSPFVPLCPVLMPASLEDRKSGSCSSRLPYRGLSDDASSRTMKPMSRPTHLDLDSYSFFVVRYATPLN